MSEVKVIKGKNVERPKASAATLNKIFLTTDAPKTVYIGIQSSALQYAWYNVSSGTVDASDVLYDGSAWLTPVSNVQEALDYLYSNGGGGGNSSPDVLIDCGTITAPNENVLIDCGTII